MGSTAVVIPTISQIESLEKLLHTFIATKDISYIYILDNGHPLENRQRLNAWQSWCPRIQVIDMEGESIYRMWNFGWRTAKVVGVDNVFILNDDAYILPGTHNILDKILHSNPAYGAVCPDYLRATSEGFGEIAPIEVQGTYGQGGLAGFAFMLRANLENVPYIDENLQWWYGDDDLVKNIEGANYKLVRVAGVPVDHLPGQSSKNMDLREKIRLDNIYFNKKYGEERTV